MEAPAAVTGPVNLGNPEEATVLALAELVVAPTGLRLPIQLPPIENDPARRRPDIALAPRPARLAARPAAPWHSSRPSPGSTPRSVPPRARHAPPSS